MIKVENVSKKIKKETLVKDINLEIHKGEIVGLVGRNGSGKTVLLKMISGFMKPTTGRVVINGKEIGQDIDFAEDTAAIIETPGFLPWQTPFSYLKELTSINKKVKKEKILETLEVVGLLDVKNKKIGEFSLGMRQRLAMAQVLYESPGLMILDEPMNSLDEQGVIEFREILRKEKEKGVTILITSHNKEDIEALCDRVFMMKNGEMSAME